MSRDVGYLPRLELGEISRSPRQDWSPARALRER